MTKRGSGLLIGFAILLVFASLIPQIPHVKAASGLTLDGNGWGLSTNGSCKWNQLLTTTQKPDVIIGLLVVNDTTTTVTGVTDNSSLFWNLRARETGPSDVQIFFYWAIASTLLSADNITFSMSSSAAATVCQGFGIAGADTNAPFDPNTRMPNMNSDTSATASVTYNTTNPNDFLIILQGFCAQGTSASSPAGFTIIRTYGNTDAHTSNCPSNYLQGNAYYEVTSTARSSYPVSWAFNSLSSPFAIIGDAIQSTPGALSALVIAGSSVVNVGQLASFSCESSGGLLPYAYSWTFGDGSTGSGVSMSHRYSTLGTMNVVCSVTDLLGSTATGTKQVVVGLDPSIVSFTASPTSLYPGGKVTFVVALSGGNGALSYSYANLPAGCLSTNSTSLTCTPTSSGDYDVTVTVTDQAGGSANAKVNITIGSQRVLGLPQAMGLAVIFGAMAGVSAIVIVSVALTLRRKRSHKVPTAT